MSVASLVRSSFRLNANKIKPIINDSFRRKGHGPGHSGVYRMMAPTALYGPNVRIMKVLQVVTWFWVFYNFWYDPDMLLGHPNYQPSNPELWTDEELGIPPDDYNEIV